LVEAAHEGKICLPNFQRDFVWTREEVADLVRSIIRGYFIGSLLLLRCEVHNPPFAPVRLRGAEPDTQQLRPELLILDGQQRLSSLIYALTAPDLSLKDSTRRRWFFVDLDLVLREPDSDEVVFDRAKRELRGLDQAEVQYEQRVLPCTALLTQQAFYSWRDGFEDWLRETDSEKLEVYRSEWRDGWTAAVTAFQTFEVPLVELPPVDDSDSESIGRVCAIFEKLNSTGVDLSVYDLLTARLYRDNIRLHDLWTEAVSTHPMLGQWSKGKADEHKFGVLVLRTLALLRNLDPKPRILINLEPEGFEDDWRRAAAAIERAIELITMVGPDGFGVFAKKWLPGFGLIPILAALRAEIETRKLGEMERAELRRWYWCNVFMERYSSAVESKSRKDYLEMTRHWLEAGPEPECFREAKDLIGAPGFRVSDSASYASARYSGVFCLLAIHNARDWRRGEDLRLQDLEDHHIFPKAFLLRHGISKRVEVNTIINRTLISNETNGKIKDKAPAEYMNNPDIFPSGAGSDLLEPHFIDAHTAVILDGACETLTDEQAETLYQRFVQSRQAAIIEEIRRVSGIAPGPAGAEEEDEDEVAADVKLGADPSEEEFADLELQP
jgi:hypothetical protein